MTTTKEDVLDYFASLDDMDQRVLLKELADEAYLMQEDDAEDGIVIFLDITKNEEGSYTMLENWVDTFFSDEAAVQKCIQDLKQCDTGPDITVEQLAQIIKDRTP